MKALEEAVRGIEKDGLVWGASKLAPVGFGIKKLQINLVVEDAKVSLDELRTSPVGFSPGARYMLTVAQRRRSRSSRTTSSRPISYVHSHSSPSRMHC